MFCEHLLRAWHREVGNAVRSTQLGLSRIQTNLLCLLNGGVPDSEQTLEQQSEPQAWRQESWILVSAPPWLGDRQSKYKSDPCKVLGHAGIGQVSGTHVVVISPPLWVCEPLGKVNPGTC